MAHQQAISAAKLQKKIGRTIEVIVDELNEHGIAIARSHADALEIDGVVYVDSPYQLEPGDIVKCVVTDADTYDLFADAIEE